jgi:hypothetical protein
MNLKGSYKALRNNSKAAMLAAIEVYNKPQMAYRDECFSILLVNAWELLLKAVLAKNKARIFYPKQRGQPYRTLSIEDALAESRQFFPPEISHEPVSRNIQMLITFRNNAIHFYNQREFRIIIYGLAQTSIVNYKDLLLSIFNVDIAHEMTLNLLPFSFGAMPDPIEFLQKSNVKSYKSKAVAQYLREISQATKELESQHFDTSRFLRECFLSGQVRLENDQIQPNLPDRSQVYRMATDCRVFSKTPSGTPTEVGAVANPQCDLVCSPYWLPMAHAAHQSAAVANCIWLLSAVEEKWLMGTYQCSLGQESASQAWA